MSADEFWKDDPQLFVSYRTSFINRKKKEAIEKDYESWLQGLYIYDGNQKINASLKQTLNNMFSERKDRNKIDGYSQKPYSEITKEKQQKDEILKKEKEEQKTEYEKSVIFYSSIKENYKNKYKK